MPIRLKSARAEKVKPRKQMVNFDFLFGPSKVLLFIVLNILLLITAPEFCNLPQALSHLTFCSKMVNFAGIVYLCHHNMHQSPTLGHIRYPLHLRVYSFLHFSLIFDA